MNLEEIVMDELLSPKEIKEQLDKTEKETVKQSIKNCMFALEHDP